MRSAVKITKTAQELAKWQRWFAWRPIRVTAGRMYQWVWWEYVMRRTYWIGSYDPVQRHDYRLIDDP